MIVIDRPTSKMETSIPASESTQFTIKESKKAFDILQSSLYSNSKRAILRELGCNALDSHTEAGNPDPFEVHLPTQLEPWLTVKDQGVGLDHLQVMTMFTTFFESTKTESNVMIGALGLGSKSPFSYSQNFTITANKNGVTNVYSAFINDDGIPSIIRMVNDLTEDRNGVEIQIPVQTKDISDFQYSAVAVYSFFDVKPKTNVTLQYKKLVSLPYDSISDLVLQDVNYGGTNCVLMGNVAYALDTKQPALAKYSSFFSDSYKHYVFKLPIGAVDILPSREGLTYTKKTIHALVVLFEKINKALTAELESKFARKCDWDRHIELKSIATEPIVSVTATDLMSKYGLENLGIELNSDTLVKQGITLRRMIAPSTSLGVKYISKGEFKNTTEHVFDPQLKAYKDKSVANIKKIKPNSKGGVPSVIFVRNDGKYSVSELQSIYRNAKRAALMFVLPESKDADGHIKYLEKQLHGLKFIKASALIAGPKVQKSKQKVACVLMTTHRGHQRLEDIPSDATHYVYVAYGEIVHNKSGVVYSESDYSSYIHKLVDSGIKVIGVTKSVSTKKLAGLVSAEDMYDTAVTELRHRLKTDSVFLHENHMKYILTDSYAYSHITGVCKILYDKCIDLKEIHDPDLRTAFKYYEKVRGVTPDWFSCSLFTHIRSAGVDLSLYDVDYLQHINPVIRKIDNANHITELLNLSYKYR